jgi:tetratricopeptide (TPR) repeat protein
MWRWLSRWFRRSPPTAEELRHQAQRYLRRRDIRRALPLLQQALEMEPSNLEARINLGVALYLSQRYEEALPHFEFAVALDANNPTALMNLAATYDALGRLDDALTLLRRIAERFPNLPDVHYNLAVALAKKGDWIKRRSPS